MFQEDTDGECFLNVVVLDMHSHVVLDKTLRAQSNAFPAVELNGLRPYHKYTVNSKVSSAFALSCLFEAFVSSKGNLYPHVSVSHTCVTHLKEGFLSMLSFQYFLILLSPLQLL